MTEAEKALVDFVLSQHWDNGQWALTELNKLKFAVGVERTTGDQKRAYMDAYKARWLSSEAYRKAIDKIALPAGVDFDAWRAEALKELHSE